MYTSNNENWARWRRAVVAGTVDGGSQQRWCRQEAVADGSGWRYLAKTEQNRGYRVEQSEGKKGRRRQALRRRRRPGDLPGWRPKAGCRRPAAARGGRRGKQMKRGGFTRAGRQGKQREKGLGLV